MSGEYFMFFRIAGFLLPLVAYLRYLNGEQTYEYHGIG